MEDLTNIYNELIMEHSMNSYNKKKLENADYQELGHNPNCGDEITLELKLDGNKIADMAFTGHGCAISQASTSIMIDTLKGKTIEEAKKIIELYLLLVLVFVKLHHYLNKLSYYFPKAENLFLFLLLFSFLPIPFYLTHSNMPTLKMNSLTFSFYSNFLSISFKIFSFNSLSSILSKTLLNFALTISFKASFSEKPLLII